MKRVLLVVGLAAAAFGQTVGPQPGDSAQVSPTVLPAHVEQKGVSATFTDVYCAGWMSPTDVSNASYVMAGEQSPNTARFVKNDLIFLSGAGWQEGQKLSIIRRVKDPNYYTIYEGQAAELKKAGNLFFDMGQASVSYVQGNTAVAKVDFSCDAIVPGDLVQPFKERALPDFHPRPFDFKHFVTLKGTTKGKIILSRDFDVYMGEGKKFYVNIGANQGLKVGDYLRIYRGYTGKELDPTDNASFATMSYEDEQFNEPSTKKERYAEIPKRSLGEAVVLMTTPTTATAMVTFTTEDIHIGDAFEVEPAADAAGNSGGSN